MDWILFVFKRSFHHYLVPAENENNAWIKLSDGQSMSIDNCKKQYSLRGTMDGTKIWKI